ncbi:nitric oxide synthase-interacting protein homolog [Lytechinus variegatus]|uniref:nitric oxide synthase-interacting protein homolog n=1 Tax=Lytechinus variegatus TaxID=7654 RepID=UPI001BB2C1D5|nr:nitric oxide synthase-interacting protein homolog [Lytechinus variegatus]
MGAAADEGAVTDQGSEQSDQAGERNSTSSGATSLNASRSLEEIQKSHAEEEHSLKMKILEKEKRNLVEQHELKMKILQLEKEAQQINITQSQQCICHCHQVIIFNKAASGYGTNKARLGKDSEKDFDCCCLALQPCKNPVITKDGYLYDKEAILECNLLKKKDIKLQMSEYEKQIKKQEKLDEDGKKSQQLKRVQDFVESESSIIGGASSAKRARTGEASTSNGTKLVSNMIDGRNKELASFWIPEHTPDAKPTLVKKPKLDEDGKKSQQLKRVRDFVESESSIIGGASSAKRARTGEASTWNCTKSVSNMIDGRNKELASFWIPEHTPDAKPTLVKKPVS